MHSACVHVHMYMHTYAAIHVICVLVGMRLYRSTGPVAISQAAAIAINRAKGVKCGLNNRKGMQQLTMKLSSYQTLIIVFVVLMWVTINF